MQKNKLKASILIWAIFLSLIITVTFVSISTKINKNLKNNSQLIDLIENEDTKVFKDKKEIVIGLKKDEIYKFKILEDTTSITINGGILTYSGTTQKGFNDGTQITENIGYFEIHNLGGYSKIQILSDKDLLKKIESYNVIKGIGNTKKIKSNGLIKNLDF